MADFLIEELRKMGMMMLFGAGMSALYDVFRILRRIIPHNKVAVSGEDLIYWLCMIIPTFAFVVEINDGVFRLYLILGILLGIFLYCKTLGKVIMMITTFICGKIFKLMTFVLKNIRKRFKIKFGKKRLKKRLKKRG